MKKILERYSFFLFLLPVFVVIHLEKEFHGVINYRLVYDKIIILFLVPVVFLFLFYLLFRSVRMSALMTFAFLLFFYFTGDLKTWLSQKLPGSIWQSYNFILVIMVLALLIIFFRLKKTKSSMRQAFFIINIAMILFITADLMQLLFAGNKGKFRTTPVPENQLAVCDTCSRPDIYYIVFDAYASTKHLVNHYGYSNLPLEENLKSKGFTITPYSRSNYNYTAFSIGSVLNMNYIENVDTIRKTYDRIYLQALKLVHNNRVFSFLQKENYRIFNHSLFDIKSFPATLKKVDPWGIREAFDQYNLFFKLNMDIGYHLPGTIKNIIGKNAFYVNSPENRDRIDSTVYHHLLKSAKLEIPEPKFVYAHFLKPHPPFFHDSLGKSLPSTITGREAYIQQVAYVNRMIEKITDSLLAYTRRPLVIVIQGDHGYSYETAVKKPAAFSNLNAIYFSNRDYSLFSDSVTNVNTFRIVFNTFFKTRLEILPDKFYYLLN